MASSKMDYKVFNDPIHGHIELPPLLVRIIDTPQFQRLRFIKQLGGTYFVFPGASHNRFEHSIGVAHLAGELAQALKTRQENLNITPADILCVQIAGLCHDLGHGPFSHLFDGMFMQKARPENKEKHEDVSIRMFEHLVKCNKLELEMVKHGLDLSRDLDFIKEMIYPKIVKNGEPWPYRGRTKDKSFLYEIVSNKANGIDVDKFDYFARDCHHLGMQNNFDHLRFLMFTRVCEVDGYRHICSRDKEVHNLYDMFNTRRSLHRRAYQHKVNKNVEMMITDALLKAKNAIKFEGSGGKLVSLVNITEDMEAFTQLTDQVFEHILFSSSPDLAQAKSILQRIMSRDLYKYVGQVLDDKPTKEKIDSLKTKLVQAQTEALPDNRMHTLFEVTIVSMDYGMKEEDPINNAYFYSKHSPDTAFKIPQDQVSKLLPKQFSEKFIRVYWKTTDSKSLEAAKRQFEVWCRENWSLLPQDRDTETAELIPGERNQNS
ncbi:deoxynucleoside triphosphate triphosphohydrolase SAMHD1-like isoform X1 [Channa argus]|uniref:deoxynucleoside triphosphate triphosphohydrolase SAMHD1-like isoform X1 n=1 Tax=Channa argus TaxID=215402 RepID=UPI0029453728|nr:hypothetical protein Q8A73_013931 [Channa argus]